MGVFSGPLNASQARQIMWDSIYFTNKSEIEQVLDYIRDYASQGKSQLVYELSPSVREYFINLGYTVNDYSISWS